VPRRAQSIAQSARGHFHRRHLHEEKLNHTGTESTEI
jgi:hypothetical protein